ncbi:hypothetical protein WH47_00242 [Habropoda laboriosa]|uniref:DUF4789 domain-containing protein n=1 Tax=Habropoda laboriosa TaxID=597456 RepID=A0A0L7R1L8_9HYME|nr:PREDICTED: uncharacterized protein LOC108572917 [Habropoda laboriosa]XP_017790744.1 PREDICTED: uncharacterized protein LOC108572917 [Habropoda laboriosa]KOC64739.1 hypothetical protein WH47_00242 [Habropoda laboriosa]
MKWVVLGITLITWSCIFCQDIVFPKDDKLPYLGGDSSNTPMTERDPIVAPNECPENMLLYPGSGSKSTWICDCRPKFLYFPLNDSCYEAYKQGPCKPQHYVVLPKNEVVPKCEKNPCLVDGVVQYNNTCYSLRTVGGPCAPKGIIEVNETTFELECVPSDIEPFIIIQAPKRQCPVGSRRNSVGICREVIH